LEAFKKWISGFRAGLPDVKVTIEDLLTDGDKVVTRWVITGTQRHELMGFAPTNKQITLSGITIQRVVDGKIAESWVEFDAGGLRHQLGGPSPGKQ
jgi:predicted ester cyclase